MPAKLRCPLSRVSPRCRSGVMRDDPRRRTPDVEKIEQPRRAASPTGAQGLGSKRCQASLIYSQVDVLSSHSKQPRRRVLSQSEELGLKKASGSSGTVPASLSSVNSRDANLSRVWLCIVSVKKYIIPDGNQIPRENTRDKTAPGTK